MPRGVYDRSKSKAQRAAEKAAAPAATAAAPTKRKYTKKASAPVAVQAEETKASILGELKKYEVGSNGQSRKNELAGAIRLLSETRGALKDTHSLASNTIDNLLSRAVIEYEKQLFPVEVQEAAPVQKVEVQAAPATSNGAAAPAPAPVAAAPVPFNPPTFAPPAQG